MFFRLLVRKFLRKACALFFFGYCLVYLVNSINRPRVEKLKAIPGDPDLCPVNGNSTDSNQSIFFLETSGEPCLTPRQACSVESAARANPYAVITVHMESGYRMSEPRQTLPGQRRSCSITRHLKQLRNVQLVKEDLLEHLKGTPLWRLVKEDDKLSASAHPLTHRSDAVRVALLLKRGGLYLDLDCLVFRSLHCLSNTVGLIDFLPNWVENGVMSFDPHHPFLDFLTKYMVFAYKPEEYISLGPATLTDAIKYFCDRENLPPSERLSCRKGSSLILQPPTAFYAISNRRQNAFYHAEADPLDWHELRYSYLAHIYDAGNGRVVPHGSFYALLARQYCPVVYQMAIDEGEF